jgi:uncharacterized cupin superfamily protein
MIPESPRGWDTGAVGTAQDGALLSIVDAGMYRRNVFRCTGLRIDATARDLRRRGEELVAVARLGGTAPARPGLLALDPPPEADTVQDALEGLRDPRRRIVDEFFWFWPVPGDPAAATVLAGADPVAAAAAWHAATRAPDRRAAAVGAHNLAGLSHAQALDAELAGRGGSAEGLWAAAMQWWADALARPECWTFLEGRVHALAVPQLSTGTVAELRAGLPEALLSVNARLAARAIADGAPDDARRQVTIIRESLLSAEAVATAYAVAAQPLAAQIRAACQRADAAALAEPDRSYEFAAELLDRTAGVLAGLDDILAAGAPTRDGVHDELALQVLRCVLARPEPDPDAPPPDSGPVVHLLERAATVAATPPVATRIRENLGTARSNLDAEQRYRLHTTCWFCGRPADKQTPHHAKMYGDVQHSYNRVHYKQLTMDVPRCAACKDRSNRGWPTGCLTIFAGLGLAATGLFSHLAGSVRGLLLLCGLLAVIASSIVLGIKEHRITKRVKLFPPVAQRLREGWELGDKPPR